MERIIPILPCCDVAVQTEFYQNLGFELVGQYTRSYLVFRYDELVLHFYGYGVKKMLPNENSSMCIIHTDRLEQLYDTFTARLKAKTGRIPRSGFPKITKIRDLSEDRRFTLTDPSGNTIFVTAPKEAGIRTFFRDIEHDQYANKFAVLYDLIYSKEDLKLAYNLLPQLLEVKDLFCDLDKAKLLLLALEIHKGLGLPYDNSELEILVRMYQTGDEWKCIKDQLLEMRSQET